MYTIFILKRQFRCASHCDMWSDFDQKDGIFYRTDTHNFDFCNDKYKSIYSINKWKWVSSHISSFIEKVSYSIYSIETNCTLQTRISSCRRKAFHEISYYYDGPHYHYQYVTAFIILMFGYRKMKCAHCTRRTKIERNSDSLLQFKWNRLDLFQTQIHWHWWVELSWTVAVYFVTESINCIKCIIGTCNCNSW